MSVSKVENSYDVNIFLDGKNAFSFLYNGTYISVKSLLFYIKGQSQKKKVLNPGYDRWIRYHSKTVFILHSNLHQFFHVLSINVKAICSFSFKWRHSTPDTIHIRPGPARILIYNTGLCFMFNGHETICCFGQTRKPAETFFVLNQLLNTHHCYF